MFDASITRNGLYLPALNNLVALYLKNRNKNVLLTSERVITLILPIQSHRTNMQKLLLQIINSKRNHDSRKLENHPIPIFINLSIAYRELAT